MSGVNGVNGVSEGGEDGRTGGRSGYRTKTKTPHVNVGNKKMT